MRVATSNRQSAAGAIGRATRRIASPSKPLRGAPTHALQLPAAIAVPPVAITISVMRSITAPVWSARVIGSRHDHIGRRTVRVIGGRRREAVSDGGWRRRVTVTLLQRRRAVSLRRQARLGRRPFILSLRVRHVGGFRRMRSDPAQCKGGGQRHIHDLTQLLAPDACFLSDGGSYESGAAELQRRSGGFW